MSHTHVITGYATTTDGTYNIYAYDSYITTAGTWPVKPVKTTEELAIEAVRDRLYRIIHQREP